ncbi:NCS2 family permease [Demequina capsici]|uniref:NCS2 family permease n=1 Tax=Demequina capsici TaxID=3075620 RepID=A0AA96F4X4_9MICO|nr:NCS2 family permease [Demequina sp. OYTSA14]WNM24126.1 NCS2 family permease [Demequina sp. OYTSA14]
MTSTAQDTGVRMRLDAYFGITERGSTFSQEIRGGLTTFFTMAYIVVLNPLILGFVQDKDGNYLGGGAAPNLGMIAAATALVAGVLTILMGAYARFPIAIAAGLGINAFVAYGLVGSGMFRWPEAMGLIVIEGALVLVLVLTKLRLKFLLAVPMPLKKAIAAGIGLFLAYIAFWDSGMITDDLTSSTPGAFGDGGSIATVPTLLFLVGIVLGGILLARRVKGALLLSIVSITVVAFIVEAVWGFGSASADNPGGWALVVPTLAGQDWSFVPDLGLLGQVSLFGAFDSGVAVVTVLMTIFSLLVVDFFDTLGTMTAVGEEAHLNDEDGVPENSQQILIVDSLAAMAGGAASVSSNTAYVESASGVGDGARTGLASVVTGLAFLVATFLSPLANIVPFEAATPVLVLVGLMMLASATDIDWRDFRIAVPAFLTIIVMPFGYSIAAGIGIGFIAYVVIAAGTGRLREIKPLMWVGAAAFAVYFALPAIQSVLGVG